MSDPVVIIIANGIFGVINTIVLGLNAYMTLKLQRDMKELATNTNSIKDALVKTTGEAEFAKGIKKGKEEKK